MELSYGEEESIKSPHIWENVQSQCCVFAWKMIKSVLGWVDEQGSTESSINWILSLRTDCVAARYYSHSVSTPVFKQLHSQASAQKWKPRHQSRVQSMLGWERLRQDCFTPIRFLRELGRAQGQLHRVTGTQEQENCQHHSLWRTLPWKGEKKQRKMI